MQTIKDAKEYLRENWEEGVDCPCCGQLVKLYDYPLNNSIALTLVKMYQIEISENRHWIHVQKEIRPSSGGYFSLAKWWGLIVSQEKNEDDDKRVSGFWALTKKGKLFIENKIRVPKKVLIYNSKKIGFVEETTNITESLNKKFSYEELMKGTNEN